MRILFFCVFDFKITLTLINETVDLIEQEFQQVKCSDSVIISYCPLVPLEHVLFHICHLNLLHPFTLLPGFNGPASSIMDGVISSQQLEKTVRWRRICSCDRIPRVTHVPLTGGKTTASTVLMPPRYSLRGRPDNEHLYRRGWWMTGPHRPIMPACNYSGCCHISREVEERGG